MRKYFIFLCFLFLPVLVHGQDLSNPACGFNNDSSNHVPTGLITTVNGGTSYSWHDFVANVPDVGGTWVDGLYGCVNKVLTNVVTLGAGQTHEYAITPAMDRGDCYVIALDANAGLGSQYVLGAPTANCPAGFGTWGSTVLSSAQMPAQTGHVEFIWDYSTPGKFWLANGNLIRFCTITGVGTTSCSTRRTFSEYAGAGCGFMDYAAMNQNGFIDVVCQNVDGGVIDIFVYDTVNDVKSAVYTTTCTGSIAASNQPGCLHKLAGPAPSNGILVQFTNNGCGNETGLHWFAYPTPTNPMPQIECLTDHVDVMANLSGQDVGLYEDFQDNSNYCSGSGFRPARTFLPLSGNPVGLMCLPAEFGWDISTRDYPVRAWGLYSVQGSAGSIGVSEQCNNSGTYLDPASSNWNPLSNEIVLVRVDADNDFTKIWRLGLTHERGQCGGNIFYSDPRASMSSDGRYVIYATNARCGTGTCVASVLTDIVVMGGSGSTTLGPLFAGSGSILIGPSKMVGPVLIGK